MFGTSSIPISVSASFAARACGSANVPAVAYTSIIGIGHPRFAGTGHSLGWVAGSQEIERRDPQGVRVAEVRIRLGHARDQVMRSRACRKRGFEVRDVSPGLLDLPARVVVGGVGVAVAGDHPCCFETFDPVERM